MENHNFLFPASTELEIGLGHWNWYRWAKLKGNCYQANFERWCHDKAWESCSTAKSMRYQWENPTYTTIYWVSWPIRFETWCGLTRVLSMWELFKVIQSLRRQSIANSHRCKLLHSQSAENYLLFLPFEQHQSLHRQTLIFILLNKFCLENSTSWKCTANPEKFADHVQWNLSWNQ